MLRRLLIWIVLRVKIYSESLSAGKITFYYKKMQKLEQKSNQHSERLLLLNNPHRFKSLSKKFKLFLAGFIEGEGYLSVSSIKMAFKF